MNTKVFLSSAEAAEFLNISVSRVYELNKEGKLPVKYIGSKPVYLEDELIQWVCAGKSADDEVKCKVRSVEDCK